MSGTLVLSTVAWLAAAGASAPASAPAATPATTPAATSVATPVAAPTKHKLILIGIDGADLEILRPIMDRGELPNIQRLAERGTLEVLNSHPPTRSPAVWTTIAVGATKEKHGVYDYVTNSYYWPKELRTKKKNTTTSDMRKLPALWTIMTEQQRSSVVVGWLSTWPAEEIQGAMVAPFIHIGNTRQTTIKGSIYKTNAPRQTFDPKLFAELKPLLKNPGAYGPESRKRYYDEPPADDPIYKQIKILKRYNYTASWTAARMHNVTASTLYLRKKFDPELVMVYYQCPDSFGHRFWHFRLSEKELGDRLELIGADRSRAAELKRRYGTAIDKCYAAVDGEIAKLLDAMGPDYSVMIMSDHGFGQCKFDKVNKSVPFDGGHREQGTVLLSGPAFKQGAKLKEVWTEDIAPTALKVLGIQPPDTMDGRVIDEALAL